MIGFIIYMVSLVLLLVLSTYYPYMAIGLIFFWWIAYKE